MRIGFQDYEIEITDDKTYGKQSTDNNFVYDLVYQDEKADEFLTSNHRIKVFQNGQLICSAIVCAVGGGTYVHENSAIITENNLYVACGDKVFSLSLPDLKLRWTTKVDMATCFGVYKSSDAIFTHGEVMITRLGTDGQIVWETGLRDIIVTVDSDKESFIMRDNYIELEDFNRNNYKLDFNGKFIEDKPSESQIRYDQIERERQKKWWKIW